MTNTAASGYTLKASDLTNHLPRAIREDYERFIKEGDAESVETLLSDHLPRGFPPFESVFVMADEWESDCLDRGEMYVCFDESDLFTKTPTQHMLNMERVKVAPTFSRWVTWG